VAYTYARESTPCGRERGEKARASSACLSQECKKKKEKTKHSKTVNTQKKSIKTNIVFFFLTQQRKGGRKSDVSVRCVRGLVCVVYICVCVYKCVCVCRTTSETVVTHKQLQTHFHYHTLLAFLIKHETRQKKGTVERSHSGKEKETAAGSHVPFMWHTQMDVRRTVQAIARQQRKPNNNNQCSRRTYTHTREKQ
jgi:hypothetical protein